MECKRIEKELLDKQADGLSDLLESKAAVSSTKTRLQKRAEDLADKLVKRAAEGDLERFDLSKREKCPLCFHPLPHSDNDWTFMTCCGKTICKGCSWEHRRVLLEENFLKTKSISEIPGINACPFCRKDAPATVDDLVQATRKLASKSDPQAINYLASCYWKGSDGVREDKEKAYELMLQATELGWPEAMYMFAQSFSEGSEMSEVSGLMPDKSKYKDILFVAANFGCADAWYDLGIAENNEGDHIQATKLLMLAAGLGEEDSVQVMKEYYKNSLITKDMFAGVLRANQSAKDEIWTKERKQHRNTTEDTLFEETMEKLKKRLLEQNA